MEKHRVKFEVMGKFYQMEVEAATPYGAIAAVEAKIKDSFKVHATEEVTIKTELDALGKAIFGEGFNAKNIFK